MGRTGASFKVDWAGLDKSVGRAVPAVGRTRRLMSAIGQALASSTKERFREGVDPEGTVWKPSARAETEGGQTLLDSGRLRSSITFAASPFEVHVGTNAVYGAIHQFGGEIKPKDAKALVFEVGGKTVKAKQVTMPARPYLGFSEEDEEEVKFLIGLHLSGAFRR